MSQIFFKVNMRENIFNQKNSFININFEKKSSENHEKKFECESQKNINENHEQ